MGCLSVSFGVLYLQFSSVESGAIQIVESILCITNILKRARKLRSVLHSIRTTRTIMQLYELYSISLSLSFFACVRLPVFAFCLDFCLLFTLCFSLLVVAVLFCSLLGPGSLGSLDFTLTFLWSNMLLISCLLHEPPQGSERIFDIAEPPGFPGVVVQRKVHVSHGSIATKQLL
jgi:hypothetical protein